MAAWRCTSCHASYDDVGPLACLLPHPESARLDGAKQAATFVTLTDRTARRLSRELNRLELQGAARARLERLATGNRAHRTAVLRTLAAAGIVPTPGAEAEQEAALPELVRDYELALRDWAWPANGENRDALAEPARADSPMTFTSRRLPV